MIRPPKPLKSFIYHTTAAYALERGITRGVPMGILRKLCHSTRWKAVFFILSVLICVVSTFFYAFSHPFFPKLRQRLEPVEPNSGGIPAWQQLHRRIPGRHPMLWLCRLCLSRPLWLRYAKQLLSGYLVSAGWNGKPIRGRTAHPKKL